MQVFGPLCLFTVFRHFCKSVLVPDFEILFQFIFCRYLFIYIFIYFLCNLSFIVSFSCFSSRLIKLLLGLYVCLLFFNIFLKASLCQVLKFYFSLYFAVIYLFIYIFIYFLCKLSFIVSFSCFSSRPIKLLFFSPLIYASLLSLFLFLRPFILVVFSTPAGCLFNHYDRLTPRESPNSSSWKLVGRVVKTNRKWRS